MCKNRPEQPACRVFPQKNPKEQGKKGGKPDISLTNAEHQQKPAPDGPQQKNKIPQDGMPLPEGAQKSIQQAESCSQNAARSKPLCGNHRYRHPKNRRQPDIRGSS